MYYKNRKQKYCYKKLIKIYKSIQQEPSLTKKHLQTLDLAFQFLIDIYILKLFETESSSKEVKCLILVVLSWTFRVDEIPIVFKLLLNCLLIYKKSIIQDNKKIKNFYQKLKLFKKKIPRLLAGIFFMVMLFYYSPFKLSKSDLTLVSNSQPVEKVQYLDLKSDTKNFFFIYKGFDDPKKTNFSDENIQKSEFNQRRIFRRLSVHDFNRKKVPKKNSVMIPLSERTCTLDKLNRKIELKFIERIKKTIPYRIVMKTRLAEDITILSFDQASNFQIYIQEKFKLMGTKPIFVITTKKYNFKLLKSYYPDYNPYSHWKDKVYRVEFIPSSQNVLDTRTCQSVYYEICVQDFIRIF